MLENYFKMNQGQNTDTIKIKKTSREIEPVIKNRLYPIVIN